MNDSTAVPGMLEGDQLEFEAGGYWGLQKPAYRGNQPARDAKPDSERLAAGVRQS